MFVRSAALALALAFAAPAAAESEPVVILKKQAKFEDVMDDLTAAVAKRGLVIDYTARIGAMLDRTAKDVGAGKRIYARAEAIQFCSATLSRRMMEADPANIAMCPYVITVYALAEDPATVFISYRRPLMMGSPASRAALKAVDDLLNGIVREAAK